MNGKQRISKLSRTSKLIACGILALAGAGLAPETRAGWLPCPTGSDAYNVYSFTNNWADGVIDNTFFPVAYTGVNQYIYFTNNVVITTPIQTLHTNLAFIQFLGGKSNGTNNPTVGSNVNLTVSGDILWPLPMNMTMSTSRRLIFGYVGDTTHKVDVTLATNITVSSGSGSYGGNNIGFINSVSGTGYGIAKAGYGNLYFEATNYFTGNLIVENSYVYVRIDGTLVATNIIVKRGARVLSSIDTYAALQVDNGLSGIVGSTYKNNSNRIADTSRLDLQGGVFSLYGGRSAGTEETIGELAVSASFSPIQLYIYATNIPFVSLTTTNLVRSPGATMAIAVDDPNASPKPSFGLGNLTNECRLVANAINGAAPADALVNGILPWAVNAILPVGGSGWCSNFMTVGPNGLTPYTNFVASFSGAGPTDNVRLTADATLTCDTNVNSLSLHRTSFVNLNGLAYTLKLTAGAINLMAIRSSGVKVIQPTLDFNGREALIFVFGSTLSVGVITNTGGEGLTFSGACEDNGLTAGWATLLITNAGAYTGPTRVNGGTLALGINTAIPADSPVLVNQDSILDLKGLSVSLASLSGEGFVDLKKNSAATALNNTLTVGGNNSNTTFAGAIQSSTNTAASGGDFAKIGTGALTLSGRNTYFGNTFVSNGVLLVNGAIAGAGSNVWVSGGATLGGTGYIDRAISVNANGILAPGADTNSVGTLAVNSNMFLNENTVYTWQYNATSADRVSVSETLTLPARAMVQAVSLDSAPLPAAPIILMSAKALSGAASLSGWTVTGAGDLVAGIQGTNVVLYRPPSGAIFAIH